MPAIGKSYLSRKAVSALGDKDSSIIRTYNVCNEDSISIELKKKTLEAHLSYYHDCILEGDKKTQ
jgi:hypothetical protein